MQLNISPASFIPQPAKVVKPGREREKEKKRGHFNRSTMGKSLMPVGGQGEENNQMHPADGENQNQKQPWKKTVPREADSNWKMQNDKNQKEFVPFHGSGSFKGSKRGHQNGGDNERGMNNELGAQNGKDQANNASEFQNAGPTPEEIMNEKKERVKKIINR